MNETKIPVINHQHQQQLNQHRQQQQKPLCQCPIEFTSVILFVGESILQKVASSWNGLSSFKCNAFRLHINVHHQYCNELESAWTDAVKYWFYSHTKWINHCKSRLFARANLNGFRRQLRISIFKIFMYKIQNHMGKVYEILIDSCSSYAHGTRMNGC